MFIRKKSKKTDSKKKVKKTKSVKPSKKLKVKTVAVDDEDTSGIDIAELASKLAPKEKEDDSVNKHKLPGKHKLKYDSIFKGKKTEVEDEGSLHRLDGFEIDPFSISYSDKVDQAEYDRLKLLKEKVYNIIIEKTEINIKNNRRKPGRIDFNKYFEIIVKNMDMRDFSHSEIFLELSWYFSENIFSMFKLLDPKWGALIVRELSEKYNISKIDGMDFV